MDQMRIRIYITCSVALLFLALVSLVMAVRSRAVTDEWSRALADPEAQTFGQIAIRSTWGRLGFSWHRRKVHEDPQVQAKLMHEAVRLRDLGWRRF